MKYSLLSVSLLFTNAFSFTARPAPSASSSSKLSAKPSSVCIIGGGFGGLYTALSLESKNKDLDITLIDSKDKFVFQPLLYELAVGTASVSEVSPKYEKLLANSNVKFVQGKVKEINTDSREISLGGGSSDRMMYDQCVIACGLAPRMEMISGASSYAIPFYKADDAYVLQSRLRSLKITKTNESVKVVVIGGGYGGVEVATNVAEYFGSDRADITIVDRNSQIMCRSLAHNRETSLK
jgi:NADH dehydrogenase